MSDSGRELRDKYGLDAGKLGETLSRDRVLVKSQNEFDFHDPLKGDAVDAVTHNGVTVYKLESWQSLLLNGSQVDRLVFHEMLLSAGYQDGGNEISKGFESVQKTDSLPWCSFDFESTQGHKINFRYKIRNITPGGRPGPVYESGPCGLR